MIEFRQGALTSTGILNLRQQFRCMITMDLGSIYALMAKTR